jgi:pentatricopeptide repeat protein
MYLITTGLFTFHQSIFGEKVTYEDYMAVVLSCVKAGNVLEGLRYFEEMRSRHIDFPGMSLSLSHVLGFRSAVWSN